VKKRYNPTPEERDERFSLYGLDPEQVVEAVLEAPPEEGPKPPESKRRRRS